MPDTDENVDLEHVDDSNEEAEIVEDQGTDNLDDEADATDDDNITEEEQAEDESEELENGDAIVALPDGSEITVSEIADLRAEGMRLADYTAKTTEVAEARKSVKAEAERNVKQQQFLETTMQRLYGFIETIIPEEPSLELAQSNPSQYQLQKATRDAAMSEVRQLVQIQSDVDAHKQGASKDAQARYKSEQDAALVKSMPHLSDPVKRTAFDKVVQETAIDFGFSEEEVASTYDARVLEMVHFARLGKKAVQNRANARRRVETPKTGKAKPSKAVSANGPNEAMQRLSKSGSIEDAIRALTGS